MTSPDFIQQSAVNEHCTLSLKRRLLIAMRLKATSNSLQESLDGAGIASNMPIHAFTPINTITNSERLHKALKHHLNSNRKIRPST